ncbi:MAG: hypothetical protein ACTHLH_00200 [Solirubrobacterales bacterium]
MSKKDYAGWATLVAAIAGVVFVAVPLSFTQVLIGLAIIAFLVLVWRLLERALLRDPILIGAIGVLLVSLIIIAVSGGGKGKTDSLRTEPTHDVIGRAPTICTISGIPDSGYLNATLTGTAKSVVAVAVWSFDDHHWYFKAVRHEGASWSAPPDPTYLWEVGQPGDPPHTTFTFDMLARSKGASHQLPGEEDGRRTIPDGFRIVGEPVTVTKRGLLGDGFNRRC